MAIRNEIIIVCRWAGSGSNFYPAVADDAPQGTGIEITDETGQVPTVVPCSPNVCFVRVRGLTNAQLTAVQGMNQYFILMTETYDNVTNVVSASNYHTEPTGPQLIAFRDAIIARFPGVNEDALTLFGQTVFRAGLTRWQILMLLRERWQLFPKLVA